MHGNEPLHKTEYDADCGHSDGRSLHRGIFVGCHSTDKPLPRELIRLDLEATQAMADQDAAGMDSVAALMLTRADSMGEDLYKAKALFYMASYNAMPQNADADSIADARQTLLDSAFNIANALNNDTLLSHIYNLKGVWQMAYYRHFHTAQYFFTKSIEIATALNNRQLGIPAEMNLSEVCRVLEDTLGLEYDLSLLDYARQNGNRFMLFSSGLRCALYLARESADTARLRPYIDAVNSLKDRYTGIPQLIYAEAFYNAGDLQSAERELLKANPDSNFSDFKILYAKILNKMDRPAESNRYLEMAWPDFAQINPFDQLSLLQLYADNYYRLGDHERSHQYSNRVEQFRDSLYSNLQMDMIQRYKVEYDVAKKNAQIENQRLRLSRTLGWGIGAVTVLLSIIGGYIVYTRRRQKYYRNIVRQNLESARAQRALNARIEELEAESGKGKGESEKAKGQSEKGKGQSEKGFTDGEKGKVKGEKEGSGVSEEKADEVFRQVHALMETDQAWRDSNLTMASMAEQVGVNRTYFSEIIRRKTGMNFAQYVNSYRIKEAVAILSDPADVTPLKEIPGRLGYQTMATFYTRFKEQTGISPAAFRKTAHDFTKHQTSENQEDTDS